MQGVLFDFAKWLANCADHRVGTSEVGLTPYGDALDAGTSSRKRDSDAGHSAALQYGCGSS